MPEVCSLSVQFTVIPRYQTMPLGFENYTRQYSKLASARSNGNPPSHFFVSI